MGGDIARANGDDAAERVDRVGPPLQSARRPPDTVIRIGIVGLERERTAAGADRIIMAAGAFESEADLDVRPRISRTDPRGLLERVQRRWLIVELNVGEAQIHVGGGNVGAQSD